MIKFLARDDETGRIGTYQTTFVIPNLNKEEKRIPMSAVVLSSQRVDLKDAIYDAAKAKDRAKDDAVESAGAGWKEVDSQRDARVWHGPPDLRVLPGVQAAAGADCGVRGEPDSRRRRATAALCVCQFVSGREETV